MSKTVIILKNLQFFVLMGLMYFGWSSYFQSGEVYPASLPWVVWGLCLVWLFDTDGAGFFIALLFAAGFYMEEITMVMREFSL